jgi:hypothetical protein
LSRVFWTLVKNAGENVGGHLDCERTITGRRRWRDGDEHGDR